MSKSIKTIVLLLMVFIGTLSSYALTAQEILNKASAKINGASSVKADFNMTINGQRCKGTLAAKGNKFSIISSVGSSWYDGKDLWSYSPSSGETTVMKPSAGELMETNPLMYAKGASNYVATLSKTKVSGKETIVLVPKSKGTGIKSVTLTLNSKTYLPEKVVVAPSSGNNITISISNLKLNASVKDSDFSYPKAKYSKAKIIDLR